MSNKTYIELINKEVDGLISEKEKQELHVYLEKDQKAKTVYQETIKTSESLKQVPEIDPSPNLKKHILNGIESNKYASKTSKKSVRLSMSDRLTTLNPKIAYSFAAGVIIGLIIYSAVLTTAIQEHSLDKTNFFGTIGIPENTNIRKLDQVPVESPGFTGTINFYKFENHLWLEANISNSDQFEMTFDFDQTKILFDGFKPLNQTKVLIQNQANTLHIIINGECHYLAKFRQLSPVNGQIDLKLIKASEVLFNYKFQLKSD